MDDDGVVNDLDAFPLDPSETKDSDNDGIGDNSETPVANEQSITIEKNTLTNPIILTGKDDDEISFIVLSQPVHGKLSGEAPTLNYTPDVNYTGADSFTFEVNDGTFTSLLATIIIDIKDDITPPVITLVGENPQYIEKNTPYVELSATADDGSVVMVDSSQVNTTLNGTYSVTYRAEDDANNTAIEVSRTVIVDDDITTFYVQDINISDSRNANIVGNYDMNGSAMTVSPDGNTAYVSGDSGGNILDISDPSSPVYISSYANNSPNYIGPENVALSKDGNTLYVAAGNEGLKVYDVSSPETPILLDDYIGTVVVGGEDIGTNIYVPGGYTSNCKAKDITLSKDGRTAYVACGANSIDIYLAARISSLQIIDVSTPSNLQLIGAYELDDGGFGTSVVLSEDEDIAYLASGYAGLKSINILNPSTPTLIATLDTQNAKDIILGKRNNNIIYVADGSSGLKIIDTINNNLNLIGKYTTTVADELTLTQDENNIYISSDTGIENINISDVRNPKFITALNIEHMRQASL